MKRLYILTLCSVLLSAGIFFFKKRRPSTVAAQEGLALPKAWLSNPVKPLTPEADRRTADQTFLTFPEWFLVFSPEEQAGYFQHRTASSFPFMSHVSQFWHSYKIVNNQIKDNFPVNTGYHFMIWVIGSSASAEYAIKAWYETVIGRITDTYAPLTAEDKFNAQFTQNYVVFIKDRPWYEFNFKKELGALWTSTPFFGEHFLRKIERRYILTSELLVKYAYGYLIGLGTKQVYEVALPTTAVVLDNDSLLYLPRYDKFAKAADSLAEKGRSFKEIAGNRSAILLTVIVPADSTLHSENARILFTQPVSSNKTLKRIALAVPVDFLHILLRQLKRSQLSPEHVFDY